MELIKRFPTLYALTRKAVVKEWTVSVFQNPDGTAVLRKEYGQTGKKISTNNRTIKKGKNIGKANETTPTQQALSEAESGVNVKVHANHVDYIPEFKTFIPPFMLPQLAKGMGKGKINYPAFMQSKLNGICCLAELCDGYVKYHSRGGHMFETLDHLSESLLDVFNVGDIMHGELYIHGWSLQKIGSYTKDLKKDAHLLQFWIYDQAVVGPIFKDRWTYILSRFGAGSNVIWDVLPDNKFPLRLTPTTIVADRTHAKIAHDGWVGDGFEGGMLRNENGIYLFEFNSNDLEKFKEFEDDEFVIIGGKEGQGNDEGCIIYRCAIEDGKEFDVRPTGTVPQRKNDYINLEKAIGEMLTVRFAELSDEGIPLQPVGIVVRDYE